MKTSMPPAAAQPAAQPEAQPPAQPEAILLLAHGTPDTLSQMAEYLGRVTGGRALPTEVVQELQHRYSEIGLRDEPLPEGPPLTRWTLLQGKLLAEQISLPVYVGMRNWHPYIADTVAHMRRDGIARFKAICLAPQNSRTSVGLYRRAVLQAAAGAPSVNGMPGARSLEVEFVAGWSAHPRLALAFADRLWPVWAEACAATGRRVPVLFTAHSVPCRTIRSGTADAPVRADLPVPADGIQTYDDRLSPDPYPVEAKQTAAAVSRCLGPVGMTDADWVFAFQSQGVAGAPWIGPTVEDTLAALAAEGHTGVVVQPIGFLCDHVEILYDIDISFRETARTLGLRLWRAESLNTSGLLMEALAEVATGEYRADIDEQAPAAAHG